MEGLAAQTFQDFSLLIVDNGSKDGSVPYLRELAKTGLKRTKTDGIIPVKLLLLAENTGFSGAVNAGISKAQSPYLLLLNNDTKAAPGFIAALSRVLDEDKKQHVFAVSPKMIQLYHPTRLDDAGDGYNLLGWAFQRGIGQPVDAPQFNQNCPVFSACAGASIYRRTHLEALRFPKSKLTFPLLPETEGEKSAVFCCEEYFDQQHFAYLEDIDLSYRARIHGFSVRYCPSAEIFHVGSGTSGSKYNAFKVRLAARNNVFLNYKNMPPLQLLLNLPGILLGVFIKLLFFEKKGFGKEYRAGFLEGIHKLGACRRTKFRFSRLFCYIKIEVLLLADTFSYVADFLRRKCQKPKTN